MLSRIAILSVKYCSKITIRTNASAVTPRRLRNYKKSLVFSSLLGSLAFYDYFAQDAEYLGAALRFMRSLKIAAQISVDYNIGLYGLDEDSEEYDKVRLRDSYTIIGL